MPLCSIPVLQTQHGNASFYFIATLLDLKSRLQDFPPTVLCLNLYPIALAYYTPSSNSWATFEQQNSPALSPASVHVATQQSLFLWRYAIRKEFSHLDCNKHFVYFENVTFSLLSIVSLFLVRFASSSLSGSLSLLHATHITWLFFSFLPHRELVAPLPLVFVFTEASCHMWRLANWLLLLSSYSYRSPSSSLK